MKRAIYPGSFDPITFGHIDIVKRALKICDELIIIVSYNSEKPNSYFTPEERVEMIKEVFADYENVKVYAYSGLTVNACLLYDASIIIRGLRMLTDFEYEYGMALTNKELNREIESIYLMTSIEYTYLSSSVAKEVMLLGYDGDKFFPKAVIKRIKNKMNK